VAPVNATQALVGKYLAYMLIGGVIGAVLTALVVTTLHVPIQASISQIAIAMGLTLFASIGLGLVISLASGSDAQAVQYTLIVLLASLFFSGFFLSLNQLQGAATFVSWLLPVSYGMQLLRDVMLRGAPLNRDLMIGLAGYGVVMFIAALLGTRRRMSVAT
jgi:ABC-2 type transport system permease protein